MRHIRLEHICTKIIEESALFNIDVCYRNNRRLVQCGIPVPLRPRSSLSIAPTCLKAPLAGMGFGNSGLRVVCLFPTTLPVFYLQRR